jgi:hypothetical protein
MRLGRRTVHLLALQLFLACVVAGCALSPMPFVPTFYLTPKVPALPAPSPTVSVYRFVDSRSAVADDKVIYRFRSISEHVGGSPMVTSRNAIRAAEPVDLGVTRAVLQGLRIRGLSTVDMTTTFVESAESPGATPIGITGQVRDFGITESRLGVYDYELIARCRITLKALDVETGKTLFDKTYAKEEKHTGITIASDLWSSLARVLVAVVEEAVSDPDLLVSLGSAGTAASAEEKSPRREISEKLIGRADSSSVVRESRTVSPDSTRVAYRAKTGNKWYVVVDGKEEKHYEGIAEGTPVFSPDSKRVGYAAYTTNKWLIVADGKRKSNTTPSCFAEEDGSFLTHLVVSTTLQLKATAHM